MAGAAAWVAKVLPNDRDIRDASVLSPNLIEVVRQRYPAVMVGVISVEKVTAEDIAPFLHGNNRPAFVVNIPKESFWTGSAIEALRALRIAFGGMGDLNRALGEVAVESYVFREYAYVEGRFMQHRRTASIDRLFDRVWRINRSDGSSLTVAISNDYDLTADAVRTAHARYAPIDILFHTNSMGRITKEAQTPADELGIELVESGQLAARLFR